MVTGHSARGHARSVFLGLAVLGAAAPLATFVPWLAQHGLDVPRLWHDIVSSRVSSFAWLDVLVTAVTVLVLVQWDLAGPSVRKWRWWPVLATLCIGPSCGLPLLLYLRERSTSTPTTSRAA